MVIIQLAGGLGNQMFQYALYLQLKKQGREVKVDDLSGFAEDAQRKPALAPFGVTYERPDPEELCRILDSSPQFWHKVRRKVFGRNKKSYFEEGKLFVPEVLTWDDIYLEGYWQSQKYFQDVEEQVRAAYDTDRLTAYLQQTDAGDSQSASGQRQMCGSFRSYLEEIDNTCSVSVHMRGGDYLTPENRTLFGGICTGAYYIEGMRRMRALYPGCRFFLFTNDKAWAVRQLGEDKEEDATADSSGDMLSDMTWVDLPDRDDSDYAAFALMSRCKHHILANSSFSWWASYLNKNPEKTVFAPERWLNGTDCRDFYRDDMRKIHLGGDGRNL